MTTSLIKLCTNRAQQVLSLALIEAQRRRRTGIAPEHLLLGILQEGSGVAAVVLQNRGATLAAVSNEIDHRFPPATISGLVNPKLAADSVQSTPLLRAADEERQKMKLNYIGTEHLLLALFSTPNNEAFEVLNTLGVKTSDIREDVLAVLGIGSS
jgi:ATP-dependent Clp protease ATP-binding subunit ClpC